MTSNKKPGEVLVGAPPRRPAQLHAHAPFGPAGAARGPPGGRDLSDGPCAWRRDVDLAVYLLWSGIAIVLGRRGDRGAFIVTRPPSSSPTIFTAPPANVVTPSDLPANGLTLGKADAPVTLDLYSDFRCTGCGGVREEPGAAARDRLRCDRQGQARLPRLPHRSSTADGSTRIPRCRQRGSMCAPTKASSGPTTTGYSRTSLPMRIGFGLHDRPPDRDCQGGRHRQLDASSRASSRARTTPSSGRGHDLGAGGAPGQALDADDLRQRQDRHEQPRAPITCRPTTTSRRRSTRRRRRIVELPAPPRRAAFGFVGPEHADRPPGSIGFTPDPARVRPLCERFSRPAPGRGVDRWCLRHQTESRSIWRRQARLSKAAEPSGSRRGWTKHPAHPPGAGPRVPRPGRPGDRVVPRRPPSWPGGVPTCGPIHGCVEVAQSQYSRPFFGIPVAVYGVVLSITLLTLAIAWWRTNDYRLLLAHYGLSLIGVAFEGWFQFAQIFLIHAVCVWCETYGLSLILRFVVALWVYLRTPNPNQVDGRRGRLIGPARAPGPQSTHEGYASCHRTDRRADDRHPATGVPPTSRRSARQQRQSGRRPNRALARASTRGPAAAVACPA